MWNNLKAWYARPFTSDMDATHWFYFFGLLLVIGVLWRLILAHIEEGLR